MHVVDRATDAVGLIVERRPGAVVAASTATIGVALAVVEGMSVSTITTTGVGGFVLAIVALTTRVLLTDVRQLRARVRHLEAELDARRQFVEAERRELVERIHQLEQRLMADDGR